MTMILKGSEQSTLFTVVYRLVGFSMVPVGMELTDLALRVWSACVPSTTVNQVYMSHQIGSVQVGPVAIDVGTMDVGALPLPHSTPISQLLTCQPPSSSISRWNLRATTFIVSEFLCLGTGFGALILMLTAVSGCLSLATRAALFVGVSGWLVVRGYCELIYWLAATTSGEETCLGNAVADVVEVWGGDRSRYLFMMSLSTAFLVAIGGRWAKSALGNFADHRSSLPKSGRAA